ncbi:MAG: prepilin-type N-terminal cleavage/methylation domain-containing protein [Lachnospiraceae bacterium]|nr:prepilin-type N-terminal cleavage/methylation domain-containing protein [Lachnospiraceae bacterium]
MKRSDDKGVTLIEVLIVMAISAILLGTVAISYGLISNANVKKAATRLSNTIRAARTQSMSMGMERGRLRLYEQHGKVYAQIGDGAPELMVDSAITCTAKYSADYNDRTGAVSLATPAELRFTSGGMLKTAGLGGGAYPDNMFLLSNGKKNMQVLVYLETGMVEMKEY